MRQYDAFKRQHPDCVLFFRMGDFYEMFDDDAVTAHKALGITLTERTPGVPMAGVPYHSVESYLRRMIEQGYRVAVCEQVQDPKEAKGVVDRAVTRVLTPGTLVDDSLLESDAPNTLASISIERRRAHLAVIELSTGAFRVASCAPEDAPDELIRRGVSETLAPEQADGTPTPEAQRLLDAMAQRAGGRRIATTKRPAWQFRPKEAAEALREQFGVATLAGFGFEEDDPELAPAGAIVRYLRETQAGEDGRATLRHIAPPRREADAEALTIDATTLRSLEIERTVRGDDIEGSLLGLFRGSSAPATPMGRRLVRDWLCRPLARRDAIEARHACVATLLEDRRTLEGLTQTLEGVQDVARIGGRLGLGRATPRDLTALGQSLSRLTALREAISNAPAFRAHEAALAEVESVLRPLADEIQRTCVERPPPHLREGGLIRDGVDAELDECRSLQRDAGRWLSEHQGALAKKHDLPSLKVGFNKVFGYYLELPSAQARRAPDSFTRKQTLKNAERYITPELKEFEQRALSAETRAIEREKALFAALCDRCAEALGELARFGETAGELDVLRAFADRAARKGWIRPEMRDEPILDIEQGRHPTLEESLADSFVPNDTTLFDVEGAARLALITGPNMAGKSTYIRQAALITLLAHAGSFVPAARARIGLTDRVFTRVGADDALHAGQSTFMVEMTETANILHHATDRSLVILDEIGRGTSTLDGLSLAWAIAERLAGDPEGAPRPRTLFATHYHELTALEERLTGRVANLHVSVREWGEEIVFLHRILPGRTDQSYGVHVAKLAGLPAEVVQRARQVLDSLRVSHDLGAEGVLESRSPDVGRVPARAEHDQLPLFKEYVPHPAIEELKGLTIEQMSPMEAFETLRRLIECAQDDASQE